MANLISHLRDKTMIIDFDETSILNQDVISVIGEELNSIASSLEGKQILLDFNRVDFMSSAMIGEFLNFDKHCKEQDIAVKFCNLSSDLRQLFEVTNLESIFDIYASREDALDSFAE